MTSKETTKPSVDLSSEDCLLKLLADLDKLKKLTIHEVYGNTEKLMTISPFQHEKIKKGMEKKLNAKCKKCETNSLEDCTFCVLFYKRYKMKHKLIKEYLKERLKEKMENAKN